MDVDKVARWSAEEEAVRDRLNVSAAPRTEQVFGRTGMQVLEERTSVG